MKSYILFLMGVSLTLSGCHYTPQKIAFTAATTSAVSVETGVRVYNEFAKAGKTTFAQNRAVKQAYEKYQAALAVCADAGAAYAATASGDGSHAAAAALQEAALHLGTTVTDLMNLLKTLGVKL
jgi:hypothetical protein